MPEATSPWRVNDVVAYDRMRAAAATLVGQLHAAARSNGREAVAARDEAARLYREVSAVDAYDRAAVTELAERISARIRSLDSEER